MYIEGNSYQIKLVIQDCENLINFKPIIVKNICLSIDEILWQQQTEMTWKGYSIKYDSSTIELFLRKDRRM